MFALTAHAQTGFAPSARGGHGARREAGDRSSSPDETPVHAHKPAARLLTMSAQRVLRWLYGPGHVPLAVALWHRRKRRQRRKKILDPRNWR
jgi:hypothetical protein